MTAGPSPPCFRCSSQRDQSISSVNTDISLCDGDSHPEKAAGASDKTRTPALFEHIQFEKALYLCRGSNWILGGKNPVICAAPHLYLYWLEAAVRKSMMGIGSASLARFHSAKALIHRSALLDQIPFAVLVSCTVSESMTNINLLFLSERRSRRALE